MKTEPASFLLESDAHPGELVSRYPHVTNALLAPWAITEEMKDVVVAIAARRLAGHKLTPGEIAEATDGREPHREPHIVPFSVAPSRAAAGRGRATTSGQIAVLPLYGVMAPRLGLIGQMSGGSSVESFMRQFKTAVNDPQISALLIDIDSPGGSTGLVAELGDLIFDARGDKPIAAVANTMAGSAAYWIAAQVDEFAVTPSGSVGSIGVYGMHTDISAALEKAGVDVTVISAGKYKTELQPYGPLTPDALTYAQETVDAHHLMFKEAVARGRGTTVADVGDNFGQGRMLMANPAKAAGMVDLVATFDQMVERLARGQVIAGRPGSSARANRRLELRAADDMPADEPDDPTMDDECPECGHDVHSGACDVDGCDCVTYEESDEQSRAAGAARLDELLADARLETVEPGSTLVLTLARSLTADQAEDLRDRIEPALLKAGHQLVVVDPKLGKLDPAPAAAAHDDTSIHEASSAPADDGAGASLLRRRAVRTAISTRPEGGTE